MISHSHGKLGRVVHDMNTPLHGKDLVLITSPPKGVRRIAIRRSACLPVRSSILKTTFQIPRNFLHIPSTVPWPSSGYTATTRYVLCTSGCMDAVMYSLNGAYTNKTFYKLLLEFLQSHLKLSSANKRHLQNSLVNTAFNVKLDRRLTGPTLFKYG